MGDTFSYWEEDWSRHVHSLKDIKVVAYSTETEGDIMVDEALLGSDAHGKLVDHRTKIEYNKVDYVKVSYYMQCHFTIDLPDTGQRAVGSCAAVESVGSNKIVYLTCAHNVKKWDKKTGQRIRLENPWIYQARQGDKYISVSKGSLWKTLVHPKYNGYGDSGYDIAIVPGKYQKVMPTDNATYLDRTAIPHYTEDKWFDVEWQCFDKSQIWKGLEIEVAGYPGQMKGWPYTHTGKVVKVTDTKQGGVLIWHDADTTKGNSGSPIMATDPAFVAKYATHGAKKIVIGVHTSGGHKVKVNFGSLMTTELWEWITRERSYV